MQAYGAAVAGLGIVPSLLMASLLAVVAAVVIVQSSTLHSIILSEEHAAQERLDVNLGMLKHALQGRGSEWRLGADGRLMVDGKVAEGLDQVVEDVARITNSVATVFAGDTRMATTVKRPDGFAGCRDKTCRGAGPRGGDRQQNVLSRHSRYPGRAVFHGL